MSSSGFVDFAGRGATAAEADIDPDRIIAWGRWTGNSIEGTPFSGGELALDRGNWSAHYLVGRPTPEGDLAALKAAGTTAVYNLIGATMPTFGDDGFEGSSDFGAAVSVTGALAANFATSRVQTSLELEFERNSVSINSGNIPIQAGAGGRFSGSGSWATSTLDASFPHNTKIRGFFAGANASRAGYAYDVFLDSRGYSIHGVAAFARGGGSGPSAD